MAEYRLTDLPTSPIRSTDKLIVSRQNVSYKIRASDLVYYLAQIDLPIDVNCNLTSDCPDGFQCVDGTCERIPCDENDFCPLGYTCINDYCYKLCGSTPDCGDGYICVDYLDNGEGICIPYPFPCDGENGCPPGFECYDGFCLQTCTGDPDSCPEGSACIPVMIDGEFFDYCVPYPFPCGMFEEYLPDPCPPGFYCYDGQCYPECDPEGCEDGFTCTEIGDGISICYPDPTQKLVNDGPLVIRTVPVDPDKNTTENIIFTANQYGRSVLTFEGFDQDGDKNPGGNNNGGSININIDLDWWNPDVNPLPPGTPGASPVRNGPLNVTNSLGQETGPIYTANQDVSSSLTFSDGIELWAHTPSSGTSDTEVGGALTVGIDRTYVNFWNWNVEDNPEHPHNGVVNGGKTSFKMAQNVDIVPNGTECNLGTDSERWKNVYTNDLHLSNEGSVNDVDGSWGNWTIQEGEDDLFIINNRTGKKFKFNLEEV
jgi:hypothetical protein